MTYKRKSLMETVNGIEFDRREVEFYDNIKFYHAWQYDDLINTPMYGKYKNIACGFFVTQNNIVLISTHGDLNGYIQYLDEILDLLTDPMLDGLEFKIHCCYPKQVKDKYPELPILSTNHSDTTSISCPLDLSDNSVEWIITILK